jgi:hypothetical protein
MSKFGDIHHWRVGHDNDMLERLDCISRTVGSFEE